MIFHCCHYAISRSTLKCTCTSPSPIVERLNTTRVHRHTLEAGEMNPHANVCKTTPSDIQFSSPPSLSLLSPSRFSLTDRNFHSKPLPRFHVSILLALQFCTKLSDQAFHLEAVRNSFGLQAQALVGNTTLVFHSFLPLAVL